MNASKASAVPEPDTIWRTEVIDLGSDPAVTEAWDRLARSVEGATVFARPAFQLALRHAFCPSRVARAVALWRRGALAGLLPLADLPLGRGVLALRETGFPRNAHTLRNHLLMAPDPDAAAALLSAWSGRTGADNLLLENLPAADGLADLLAEVARELGFPADAPTPGRVLDYADLFGGYDTYLATRSGQMRRQLRAKRRSLEAAGRLGIEALTGDALRDALPEWRGVVAASWQGTDPGGVITEADRALHAALAENGRLWLLRLDGRPAAALRMLEDDRAAYVHTMHFDAAFRPLSPGVVLFDAMMHDACERGLPRVDFNGRTGFFSRWATGATEHQSVRIYRPGPRGRIVQAARRWRRRATPA